MNDIKYEAVNRRPAKKLFKNEPRLLVIAFITLCATGLAVATTLHTTIGVAVIVLGLAVLLRLGAVDPRPRRADKTPRYLGE